MEALSTDEHIEKLYKRDDEITATLEKMLTAFLGNERYGSPGYRHRIESNEKELKSHRRRMNEMEKEHRERMDEMEKAHQQKMTKVDQRFTNVYQKVLGICIGVSVMLGVLGWVIKNWTMEAQANPVPRIERVDPAPFLSTDPPPVVLDSTYAAPEPAIKDTIQNR